MCISGSPLRAGELFFDKKENVWYTVIVLKRRPNMTGLKVLDSILTIAAVLEAAYKAGQFISKAVTRNKKTMPRRKDLAYCRS